MSEKLTDGERNWLTAPGNQTWPDITRKALRIIDAQAEALALSRRKQFNEQKWAEKCAEVTRLTETLAMAERERDGARTLADETITNGTDEAAWHALLDAQTEAYAALRRCADRDQEVATEWKALAEARQIDLRVLETECERLRAVLADVNAHALNKMAERNAAEAECERLRAELPEIKSQKGVSNG